MSCKFKRMLAAFASAVLAWAVLPTVFAASALAEESSIELGTASQIEVQASGEEGPSVSVQSDKCPKGGTHSWESKVQKATFGKDGCWYGVCTKCGLDTRDDPEQGVAPIIPITKVKLSKTTFTYSGKACKPTATVYTADGPLATDQYKVTYSNNINAGEKTAIAKVTMTSDYYEGTKKIKFTIAPAQNPLAVKGKTASVAYKDVKKGNVAIKRAAVLTVKNAQGTVTYAKKSGNAGITINKKGVVTVKKGTKKGTYTIKAKVKAAGNTNYAALIKVVAFKVTVA